MLFPGSGTTAMSQSAFHLEPVPPFRLDLTVWTLGRALITRWTAGMGKPTAGFCPCPPASWKSQSGPADWP
jgi:hypothetical protein